MRNLGTKHIGLLILIGILSLASCSLASESKLAFEPHIAVSASGETTITGEVRNEAAAIYSRYQDLNGVLQVYDDTGSLVACVEAPTMAGPLKSGESHFPAGWKGDVPVGTYELTWGAPPYGATTVQFTIIEQDGHLHLGSLSPLVLWDPSEGGPLRCDES
jgi:hypothetical protein